MSGGGPFRWAVFGTGSVSRKFVLGLRALGGRAVVSSVASRNPENARRFAASLGVARAASSWEDAVAVDIDAVYVATPASEHEAHALLAIGRGKPVLIEKPLAPDATAAHRIAQAAETAGVFAMEALWTRFLPLVAEAKARVDRGDLGEIRGFHATFLAANIPDAGASIFDPARAGGALLHRGIYPLSLARHLCGPVTGVSARGLIGATGVDEDAVVILAHASGALSTVRASLRTSSPNGATLWGTKGTLEIAPPVWRPETARFTPVAPQAIGPARPRRFEAFRESRRGQKLAEAMTRLRGLRGGSRALSAPFLGNGYTHEALALMNAVAAGQTQSAVMPLSQSIEVLEVIDAALARIGEATP